MEVGHFIAAPFGTRLLGLETEDGARDKFGPRIPDVDLAVRCLEHRAKQRAEIRKEEALKDEV